jgi:hypothetical protein
MSGLLIACEKTEDAKTVEYYLSNEKELDKKLAECKDSDGKSKRTPDCDNAKAADYKRNVL